MNEGFIQELNFYHDALLALSARSGIALSAAELRVTQVVLRQMMLRRVRSIPLSYSDLERMAGLSRKGVAEGLAAGIRRGTILRTGEAGDYAYSFRIVPLEEQATNLREAENEDAGLEEPCEARDEMDENNKRTNVLEKAAKRITPHSWKPGDPLPDCCKTIWQRRIWPVFCGFWRKYPKKRDWPLAWAEWAKLISEGDYAEMRAIFAGMRAWRFSDNWKEGILLDPERFLKRQRYLDPPQVAVERAKPKPRPALRPETPEEAERRRTTDLERRGPREMPPIGRSEAARIMKGIEGRIEAEKKPRTPAEQREAAKRMMEEERKRRGGDG